MIVERSGPGSEQVEKVLRELARRGIEVGFQEDKKYPDGTPIAYVAAIQEFGYKAIPPRPFFRPTVAEKSLEWGVHVARGAIAAAAGKITVDAMLTQVGMVAAADVQASIVAVTSPPLAMTTLLLRKRRSQGATIGGKAVGQAYADVNMTGPRQKALDVSGVSTKPLVDTGQMLRAVDSTLVDV